MTYWCPRVCTLPLGNRLSYHSTTLNCICHECNYTACDYLRFIWFQSLLYAASVAGVVVTLRGTSARPLNAITTFTLIGSAWLRLPELARPENGQKWLCCPPPHSSPLLLRSDPAPLWAPWIWWGYSWWLDWCSPHQASGEGAGITSAKPLVALIQ